MSAQADEVAGITAEQVLAYVADTRAAGDPNVMPIWVKEGPAGLLGAVNMPYVSVTVCAPATHTCATIDNVLLDTGSSGLRLMADQLPATLNLPALTAAQGDAVWNCGKFGSGTTWGAVLQADVQLGGMVARGVSVQAVAPSDLAAPTGCEGERKRIASVAQLRANGILGVGHQAQDCGFYCALLADNRQYFRCNASQCAPTTVPTTQQLANPVARLPAHNNGVHVAFARVPVAQADAVPGVLVLGINTHTNNSIDVQRMTALDASGQLTLRLNGQTFARGRFDTGSNAIWADLAGWAACPTNTMFFCPEAAQPLLAEYTDTQWHAPMTPLPLRVTNADDLPSGTRAAAIAGSVTRATDAALGPQTAILGMPAFYGRIVSTVFSGQQAASRRGPLLSVM